MPKVFKTLANIAVWALWICAWIAFLSPFIFGGLGKGWLWKFTADIPMGYWISYALAVATSLAAGYWMVVRKKLEG